MRQSALPHNIIERGEGNPKRFPPIERWSNKWAVTLAGVAWTNGASAGQQKWDVTDPIITAVGSTLSAVRYAVIRLSGTSVTSGHLLCFAALSTAEFDVSTGNTLTIQMAATGVFTLT